MHQRSKASRVSPVDRIAVAALIAGLLLPALGRAEEAPPEELTPIEESHWYDGTMRALDVAVDVFPIRPLSAVTLGVGAVLFVPAAVMTAPNGWESITDAWERFVIEPGEYLWARPLGDL
jgi:hypothetical protein